MRIYKVIPLAAILISAPAISATRLPFGSRAGMGVTIISERGLDTSHAVIMTKHTRQDAAEFCVEYVGRVTAKCVNDQLNLNLNDRVTGNCKTGEFFDFFGKKYRFEGRMQGPSNGLDLAKYVIRDIAANEVANGTSASGYSVSMQIFRALCPNTAPLDE